MRVGWWCFAFCVLAAADKRLPPLHDNRNQDQSLVQNDVVAPTSVNPSVDKEHPVEEDSDAPDPDMKPTIHSGFLPLDPDAGNYDTKPLILPEPQQANYDPETVAVSPDPDATPGEHTVDWNWGTPDAHPSPSVSAPEPSAYWPVEAVFSNLPLDYYTRSETASISLSGSQSLSTSVSLTRTPSSSRTSHASKSATPSVSISRTSSISHSRAPDSQTPSTTISLTPSTSKSPSLSKSPHPSYSPHAPSKSPSRSASISVRPSKSPYPVLDHKPEGFIPHQDDEMYQEEEDKADWGYDTNSQNGPGRWHLLNRGYSQCGMDSEQSPINLEDFNIGPSSLPLLSPSYKVGQMLIRNTGNYIKVVTHRANRVFFGSDMYNLMYVGIHNPSDHTLNGETFPAELQFIHKHEDNGSFLGVSLLLDYGDGAIENTFLKHVLGHIPHEIGETMVDIPFDLMTAFPIELSASGNPQTDYPYFTYKGSLTTPPCTENMRWVIWSKPSYISEDQLDKLESKFKVPGHRPIQENNGRPVQQKTLFM